MPPNNTPSWEVSANRANSQGGNPHNSAASQEVSAVHPNSITFQEGSANSANPPGKHPLGQCCYPGRQHGLTQQHSSLGR